MAMMNSTRAILLFVLGTCLYQLSLAEEGTGALYRHIAMLSAIHANFAHLDHTAQEVSTAHLGGVRLYLGLRLYLRL
jgi:hypothetical protein